MLVVAIAMLLCLSAVTVSTGKWVISALCRSRWNETSPSFKFLLQSKCKLFTVMNNIFISFIANVLVFFHFIVQNVACGNCDASVLVSRHRIHG